MVQAYNSKILKVENVFSMCKIKHVFVNVFYCKKHFKLKYKYTYKTLQSTEQFKLY